MKERRQMRTTNFESDEGPKALKLSAESSGACGYKIRMDMKRCAFRDCFQLKEHRISM